MHADGDNRIEKIIHIFYAFAITLDACLNIHVTTFSFYKACSKGLNQLVSVII